MKTFLIGPCALALGLIATPLAAKPIAFAQGWTFMGEYGGRTMTEVQGYYAPGYRYSLGGGWIELEQEDGDFDRRVAYVRANALLRRWNLPAAQGNLFAWGGVGRATGSDFEGATTAANTGLQADYETRRVYASLRSDLQYSRRFAHRIDTVQLGWSPYAHEYDSIATWFLVQARHTTGELYDGVEPALVLRLFKGPVWVEIGGSSKGEVQAMFMLNY